MVAQSHDRCFLLGRTEMNTEMNVWNAFGAKRGERKGALRESAHLSDGGNYSTTPSPVTRGLGVWGRFKGRPVGTLRHGVGGCCYPESNWPETSCAVPADFHNDRISPATLSLSLTNTATHSSLPSFFLSLMVAVLSCLSRFSFLYTAHNRWVICSVEILFLSLWSPPSASTQGKTRSLTHLGMEIKGQPHNWFLQNRMLCSLASGAASIPFHYLLIYLFIWLTWQPWSVFICMAAHSSWMSQRAQ